MPKNRGDYLANDDKYYQWLRSQLRKVWSKHPTKLHLLKTTRFKLPDVKAFQSECNICKHVFPTSKMTVDHLISCGSVKDIGYVDRLLNVALGDLQVLCKECHDIKTLAERRDISFEEAKIEKQVIAFGKLSADKQIKIIGLKGKSNSKQRVELFRQQLKQLAREYNYVTKPRSTTS